MKSMYCPHCGTYVGDCGHVAGGYTGPSTLSGTCGKCERAYSVTCNGDCLGKMQQSESAGLKPVDLKISEDGRAIVDETGNEIARFRDGLVFHLPKKYEQKLPGHMVCRKECIAWDNHGKCVQYVQSCTWEFPPYDF